MFHAHFHRESLANFPVINIERSHLGFAFSDPQMAGSIMPHEDDVLVEIDRIIFGKRSARSESIHDLHRLRVFHLIFTSDGDSTSCKQ